MNDENVKLLIKNEYENGLSMKELAKKYSISESKIKRWSSKEKWIKKKRTKKTNRTKKNEPNQNFKNNKKTQIKLDILNGATEKEVVEKFGVSSTTYYNHKNSVRNIQIEQSEKLLQTIAEEKYKDIKERLVKIIEEKDALIKELLEKTTLGEREKHKLIKERLSLLREIEKDIKTGARIISDYRMSELEQQLENEKILRERIELEKTKNKETGVLDLTIVEDYK